MTAASTPRPALRCSSGRPARVSLLTLAGLLLWLLTAPALQAGPQHWAAADATVQGLPATRAASAGPRTQAEADLAVTQAQAALQQARRALSAGQAPLPGERQHLVNGHSRLTSTYFDRIHRLEKAVADARAALQASYSARDALVP